MNIFKVIPVLLCSIACANLAAETGDTVAPVAVVYPHDIDDQAAPPRLAIITGGTGNPRSGILSDLMLALFSDTSGFEFVEREEVSKIVDEQLLITMLDPGRVQKRRIIGASLRADILVFLYDEERDSIPGVSIILIETQSGLRFLMDWSPFDATNPIIAATYCAKAICDAERRITAGIKGVVAIPPLLCKDLNLTHTDYGLIYARHLQRVLLGNLPVAIVELEEANALINEAILEPAPSVEMSLMPVIIRGIFQNKGVGNERFVTVSLDIHHSDLNNKHISVDSIASNVILEITQPILDEVASALNVANGTEWNSQTAAESLLNDAEKLCEVGRWRDAIPLYQNMLLLHPRHCRSLCQLYEGYVWLVDYAGLDHQEKLDAGSKALDYMYSAFMACSDEAHLMNAFSKPRFNQRFYLPFLSDRSDPGAVLRTRKKEIDRKWVKMLIDIVVAKPELGQQLLSNLSQQMPYALKTESNLAVKIKNEELFLTALERTQYSFTLLKREPRKGIKENERVCSQKIYPAQRDSCMVSLALISTQTFSSNLSNKIEMTVSDWITIDNGAELIATSEKIIKLDQHGNLQTTKSLTVHRLYSAGNYTWMISPGNISALNEKLEAIAVLDSIKMGFSIEPGRLNAVAMNDGVLAIMGHDTKNGMHSTWFTSINLEYNDAGEYNRIMIDTFHHANKQTGKRDDFDIAFKPTYMFRSPLNVHKDKNAIIAGGHYSANNSLLADLDNQSISWTKIGRLSNMTVVHKGSIYTVSSQYSCKTATSRITRIDNKGIRHQLVTHPPRPCKLWGEGGAFYNLGFVHEGMLHLIILRGIDNSAFPFPWIAVDIHTGATKVVSRQLPLIEGGWNNEIRFRSLSRGLVMLANKKAYDVNFNSSDKWPTIESQLYIYNKK